MEHLNVEQPVAQQDTVRPSGPNMAYILSQPGILKILMLMFLLIAFTTGLSCCTGFFIWAGIIAWIHNLILFILFAGNWLHLKGNQGKWSTKMLINSLLWFLILILAYSLLVVYATGLVRQGYSLPTTYYVTVAFGYLCGVLCFCEVITYAILRRSSGYQ